MPFSPTEAWPGHRVARDGPGDPGRILASVNVVVYDWDIVSDRIDWAPNAAEVLGVPDLAAWSTGRAFAEVVEDDGGATRQVAILAAGGRDQGSGIPYTARYGLRVGLGRTLRVEDSGRWFAGQDGQPALARGLMRVTAADGDDAGFRERDTLLRHLAAEIAEGRRTGRPLSLFVVALAGLGDLNEELGFERADLVVETVARRLRTLRRQRDRFVRYAGNRFAILLRGCGPEQTATAAARLSRLVADEAIATGPEAVSVDLVIGGASFPEHAVDAAGLFRRAEQALSLAKRRSDCPFLLYDPAAFRATPRRTGTVSTVDCLDILNGRRIALACQPIVAAATREVAFSEALLRLVGEGGRLVAASDVIPGFERAGLVHLADARMLELAADHLAAHPEARVSLNVSPLTLETGEWLPLLSGHLGARPGTAERLIVEITETAAIRDPAETRRLLEGMKKLGVTIAIDDFGSGHTSFRHLRDFPVDIVKIDGVFVQNLARQPSDRFFVKSLVDLARHLGLATVAEWVEDEESAALLLDWGVDYFQGDLFGAPALVAAPEARPRAAVAA